MKLDRDLMLQNEINSGRTYNSKELIVNSKIFKRCSFLNPFCDVQEQEPFIY